MLIQGVDLYSIGAVTSSPTSLSVAIDSESNYQSSDLILRRSGLTIIIVAPLFMIATFRRATSCGLRLFGIRYTHQELDLRMDALAISLCFPSMLYSLGILGYEPWLLALSILLTITLPNKFLSILLLLMVGSVDFGDGIVISMFAALSYLFTRRLNTANPSKRIYLQVIAICVFYIFGLQFLHYAGMFSLVESKAGAIREAIERGMLVDKYPIILRPLITYVTLLFYTPACVKVPLLYLAYLFPVVIIVRKSLGEIKNLSGNVAAAHVIVQAAAACTTIFAFVFTAPSHANAKYYVFLLPVFLNCALLFYSRTTVLAFVVLSNVTVAFHLWFYRA